MIKLLMVKHKTLYDQQKQPIHLAIVEQQAYLR